MLDSTTRIESYNVKDLIDNDIIWLHASGSVLWQIIGLQNDHTCSKVYTFPAETYTEKK